MTLDHLAASIGVIKNLLLMKTITNERAALALWALLDETHIDSIHYVKGWSATIDKLIEELSHATPR